MSVSLPLLTRVSHDDVTFLLTPRARAIGVPDLSPAALPAPLQPRMPDRKPGPGEQYRFHFDMSVCIGCKCCVVACNEQNGNPAELNWRRVGEIEGGWYPDTQRAYFSMGCNHCVEPTCLTGCPVDAYSKDPGTGIVRHSADTCIGCQYCTWNCSYGVPQFNPERGVVGKCDMCHGRLERDQSPACVSACPEGAIRIEIVNVADWRAAVAAFEAKEGLPRADASVSTTRVTMPAGLPPGARPLDLTHVKPDHPHWPLVVMTVLTQMSVGAFAALWLQQITHLAGEAGLRFAAVASVMVANLALGASTLHLGRPAHAYRALKMWKRSWLSREVLLFSIFAGVAQAYAAVLWFGTPGAEVAGAFTVLSGAAGVTATAYIYRVASRPAWNSVLTLLQFMATAALLGPAFAAAIRAGDPRVLRFAVAGAALLQLVIIAIGFLRLIASDEIELRGTARLLSTVLAPPFVVRGLLLLVAGIALPLISISTAAVVASAVLLLASEIIGRYLFFVSVVPKHMTTPYLAMGSEAA
jgi:Fe-S-cluster-containing dehydrogenase component/DMSO reductase anchor subunit